MKCDNNHPADVCKRSSAHGVHSSPSARNATLAVLCGVYDISVCVTVIWCVLYLTAA